MSGMYGMIYLYLHHREVHHKQLENKPISQENPQKGALLTSNAPLHLASVVPSSETAAPALPMKISLLPLDRTPTIGRKAPHASSLEKWRWKL